LTFRDGEEEEEEEGEEGEEAVGVRTAFRSKGAPSLVEEEEEEAVGAPVTRGAMGASQRARILFRVTI